jgi:hypothetical protein
MTRRIAISLSDDLYRQIESARRSRRQTRSAFIQEAVGDYVTGRDEAALEKAYFEGYVKVPDSDADFVVWERESLDDLAKRGGEDEWRDAPSTVRSCGRRRTKSVPSSSRRGATRRVSGRG